MAPDPHDRRLQKNKTVRQRFAEKGIMKVQVCGGLSEAMFEPGPRRPGDEDEKGNHERPGIAAVHGMFLGMGRR